MAEGKMPEDDLWRQEYQQGASGRVTRAVLADGRNYDPNNPSDNSARLYPLKTLVVLHTPTPNGDGSEYRIGVVARSDMERGLRSFDGVRLNRHVVERCFTEGTYNNDTEARALAESMGITRQPEGGIKVLHCLEPFPGTWDD